MKKLIYLICIFIVLSTGSLLNAAGIHLIKSVVPPVGAVGDTVTVCITIDPSVLTIDSKADIMWVIDCTGSMGSAIQGVKDNITSFTSQLVSQGIDYRQGLEEYRDIYDNPIGGQINHGFASDDAQFLSWVSVLTASGGGDLPETGLEAMQDALYNTGAAFWRPDASKTMILVTDAPVKSRECGSSPLSLTYTAADLAAQGVKIDAVCNDASYATLCNPKNIPSLAGGIWLDYSASSWATFLASIAKSVGNYTNVVVRDPMPPELVPIDSACGASVSGNELRWTITQLGSGVTYPVCCFGARITSRFEGSISNTAYVEADGLSETSSNCSYVFYPTKTATCTVTQTITPSPTVTISATFTSTSSITATITITPTCTISPTFTATPVPLVLNLVGNFPNPFMDTTDIVYWLSCESSVELKVYTVSG
jgi:hypothetical protein